MPVNEPPRSPFTIYRRGIGLRPQTVEGPDSAGWRRSTATRSHRTSRRKRNFTAPIANGRRRFRLVIGADRGGKTSAP